ncbi:hypothetical protein PsYK624_013550 [Phanerochaete sordida]|uniref:Uncharacterized protein n=1 Tax=Phanerochaete sordida TaxID=48140 RepID=A0A9P3FZ77_9APHY|nr:hypothetical protein PsYK624_013550 [Phanerochaete sordida]
MLAVQKPVTLFSSPQGHFPRPSHSRLPSAPVVIRSTQTPGLLSLSKPAQQHQSRPQSQSGARAARSPKGKQQRPPQPAPAQAQSVEEGKKAKASKPRTAGSDDDSSKPAVASPEKSPRGRRSAKAASKDKPEQSPSTSRTHARRQSHQPSPPPARIPTESETSRASVNPFRAQSSERESASNLFDPFVANSTSDNESSEVAPAASAKDGAKPLSFRAPPQLASRPTGKLAHRRQTGQIHGSPTPTQAMPVRSHGSRGGATLSRSTPNPAPVTPPRRAARRAMVELPLAQWDEFPICDDMTVSSPTTPVRESASGSKHLGATWQQTLFDDAPRTAPLTSTFDYPFAQPAFTTPSPAARRRHHQRVPSEGVFGMSTDEDSSSESADELKNVLSKLTLSGQRSVTDLRRTPSPSTMDGMPAGFYAGSVFQNSPSPEELPVPAFRV